MKKLDSRRNMGKGSKKPTLTRQKDISRYMTKDPLSMDDKKVTIVPILANQLTEEQINDYKKAFAMFDEDNDGTITSRELELVMRELGQKPSNSEIKQMISSVDYNGSGSIEFPEFLLLMASRLKQEDPAEEVKQAFRTFDKDNDGFMDICDLRDMLENYGDKMSMEEIEEFLRTADRHRNGRFDYEDFASHLGLSGLR